VSNRKIFSYILQYLLLHRSRLIIAFISIATVSGSILSLGVAVKTMIDKGINGHDINSLNHIILYILILVLLLGFASFVRSFCINSMGEKIIDDIRRKTYGHLLSLKFPEFEYLEASDIVTRLSSDLSLISRMIIDIISFCLRNTLMFVGSIILMFMQSSKLSLIALMIVPILLVFLTRLGKQIRVLAREVQGEESSLYNYINETFSGIKTIYAFNAQTLKKRDFASKSEALLVLSLKRLSLRSIFFALVITSIMCSVLFVIWVGAHDVLAGRLSSGALVSFIFYAISAAMSIGGIAEVASEFWRCLAGAERVFLLLENNNIEVRDCGVLLDCHGAKAPRNDDNSDKKSTSRSKKIIEFKDVSFTYPSRPEREVLSKLNLAINAGEFVAIVGPSGGGKSTIAQLLLKFFESDNGSILVNEVSLSDVTPNQIRSFISYVEQDPYIFSTSIRDNLELSGIISDDIIKITALGEVIERLPEGLDSALGARGAQLSGGERQRVAIARAIMRGSEILLLDEATSALDQKSEREILSNMRKLLPNKTIISIAHRIASIEHADRIFVVDSGAVLASGKHDDLLQVCPLYHKLCSEDKL
jgi:ATP-binding cassette subfamily B protein